MAFAILLAAFTIPPIFLNFSLAEESWMFLDSKLSLNQAWFLIFWQSNLLAGSFTNKLLIMSFAFSDTFSQ